jgi:hypothetical protein
MAAVMTVTIVSRRSGSDGGSHGCYKSCLAQLQLRRRPQLLQLLLGAVAVMAAATAVKIVTRRSGRNGGGDDCLVPIIFIACFKEEQN